MCVLLTTVALISLAAATKSVTLAAVGATVYYGGLFTIHALHGRINRSWLSLMPHLLAPVLALVVFFMGFFVETADCVDDCVPAISLVLSFGTLVFTWLIALVVELFWLSRDQMEH